jgi:hypothetical protein
MMIMKPLQYVLYVDYDTEYICVIWTLSQDFLRYSQQYFMFVLYQ